MQADVSVGVIAFAFAVWAAKEIYQAIRGETKANTEATRANTLALVELKVRLEEINKLLADIPKMRKDIDAAHENLRQNIRPRSKT